LLGTIDIPWYVTPGNHDSSKGQDYVLWDKTFPKSRNTSFKYDDYLFVNLDTSNWKDTDDPEDVQRREFLSDILDKNQDKRVIIYTHVPLVQTKKEKPYNIQPTTKRGLLDIISSSKNVVAVITGHVHLNDVKTVNGINHIVTSSLATEPCMYRYFEVYENRIETSSYPISIPRCINGIRSNWKSRTMDNRAYHTSKETESFTITLPQKLKYSYLPLAAGVGFLLVLLSVGAWLVQKFRSNEKKI